MATRTPSPPDAANASYLRGDPTQPDPIEGGRLEVDAAGLRFTGPGGRELRLDGERMLGVTISGRSAERRRGRRGIHGTMRVAALRDRRPTEWVFAVDRSAAARLRSKINNQRQSSGRAALPFVEELVGILARPAAAGNGGPAPPVAAGNGTAVAAESAPAVNGAAAATASIPASNEAVTAAAAAPRSRRRKWLPWVILGVVLLAAEIAIPVVLISGG